MAKSNAERSLKPYPGFPLTAHVGTNRWCKKINRKLHYFGKLDDPNAALEKLNRELSYLKDGRTPPPLDAQAGLTVRTLCNHFLTAKKARLEFRAS